VLLDNVNQGDVSAAGCHSLDRKQALNVAICTDRFALVIKSAPLPASESGLPEKTGLGVLESAMLGMYMIRGAPGPYEPTHEERSRLLLDSLNGVQYTMALPDSLIALLCHCSADFVGSQSPYGGVFTSITRKPGFHPLPGIAA